MSKVVEGEKYLNTQEVRTVFDKASKKRFYDNIKPYLRVYHFDARRAPWYRENDVLALKMGKPIRKASIGISGILGDWTVFLRSLGYRAETIDREIAEGVTLPEDAVKTFRLPADKKFIKRSRMTFADETPICLWDSYDPEELAGDILAEMKQGVAHGIMQHIKEKHGVVVGIAKDKYTARVTTFEEQNLLHLLNDEPVLILQRVSYTKDRKVLALYQDMVLLGNWFAPEHEYPVHVWDD